MRSQALFDTIIIYFRYARRSLNYVHIINIYTHTHTIKPLYKGYIIGRNPPYNGKSPSVQSIRPNYATNLQCPLL